MKAEIPDNEPKRLQVLRACRVLDTPPELAFDNLTDLAARLCGTPIALVSLVDETRQWFKSRLGVAATQTHRDHAFCGYAILTTELFEVSDATLDPRFQDNPLVTGEPFIRFYAGAPIQIDGVAVGSLCVIDNAPRTLRADQRATLVGLAAQVAAQLRLRRAVHEVEQAREAAECAAAAKAAFFANVSHEIRTPMTAILGFTELLEDRMAEQRLVGEAADRNAISAIARNSELLLAILNDILDASKIESGLMRVEALPTDPRELTAQVVAMFPPRAERTEIALTWRCDADVPPLVAADPLRLRQILLNLVGNAIKFTDRGSVAVHLSRRAGSPEMLRFDVSDTGIGIHEDRVNTLFAPFVQADATTTRRFGGTGLGLHISRQLARMMGGDLSVRSEYGVGSTFTLELPLSRCPADPQSSGRSPRAPRDGASDQPQPLAGKRVLLAEDGPDNQRLVGALLERAGASVSLVENGRDAADAVVANAGGPHEFDLLLFDLHMPMLDGQRAIERIRAAGIATPAAALSANVLSETQADCLARGFNRFIEKPVRRRELIDACRALLAGARRAAAAAI